MGFVGPRRIPASQLITSTLMTLGKAKSLLRRFWARPLQRQVLLLAGALALLVATWKVRRWPFPRLAESLGTASPPHPLAGSASLADPCLANELKQALEVSWAIAAWSRVWPCPPTCLMQAVAAREMLVSRGLPCQIYFGVRSQLAGPNPSGQSIGAHAWLRCAGTVVTGSAEAANFQPIAMYVCGPDAGAAAL
jgi:Transglutaminase-like superfamily